MKLTKLFKAVGVAAIIGACLLPTACENGYVKFEAGSQSNNGSGNGNGNGNGGGDTTTTSIPATAEEANAGLIIEGDTVKSEKTGIDFTDYSKGSYSILVNNNTTRRLIAFETSPDEDNLISGIPAGKKNFGLYKRSSLFSTSHDFVLFLVTEEDYIANRNNLKALEATPFTRLYAYYNVNAINNYKYEISSVMGGTCSIVLQNDTDYNVELRKDGINGETIGYAGYGSVNTTFKVNPAPGADSSYYVFPVFRRFDDVLNEIVTVYPKTKSGKKAIVEIFAFDNETKSVELDARTWIKTDITFSPSAAYLKIVNNAPKGISLYRTGNTEALMTSTGGNIINANSKPKVFAIPMERVSGSSTRDAEFEEYISYAGYCVGGPAGISKLYLTTGTTDIGSAFKFYAGKMYTVEVNWDNEEDDILVDLSWMDMDNSSDVIFSNH